MDNPRPIGGITIGYDFVRTGFAAYNWPDWMKYFSFALDFTYEQFRTSTQFVGVTSDGGTLFGELNRTTGTLSALTFLFMGKYGFYCDSVAPFGRIVPYVGVGPAVAWSSFRSAGDGAFPDGSLGLGGSASSTDIALVVEGGVRWVLLSNVSFDTSFRYRWLEPKYSLDNGVTAKTTLNAYTALFRINYHF